jgi:hypothetical protein
MGVMTLMSQAQRVTTHTTDSSSKQQKMMMMRLIRGEQIKPSCEPQSGLNCEKSESV